MSRSALVLHAFSLSLLLAISGCTSYFSPEASAGVPFEVVTGTSYGECMGWCVQSITADAETAVLTIQDYDPATPDSVVIRSMEPAVWSRIEGAFDARAFEAADPVYGCPDCADGGAEWVEVRQESGSKRVQFEAGSDVPRLSDLISSARSLYTLFED